MATKLILPLMLFGISFSSFGQIDKLTKKYVMTENIETALTYNRKETLTKNKELERIDYITKKYTFYDPGGPSNYAFKIYPSIAEEEKRAPPLSIIDSFNDYHYYKQETSIKIYTITAIAGYYSIQNIHDWSDSTKKSIGEGMRYEYTENLLWDNMYDSMFFYFLPIKEKLYNSDSIRTDRLGRIIMANYKGDHYEWKYNKDNRPNCILKIPILDKQERRFEIEEINAKKVMFFYNEDKVSNLIYSTACFLLHTKKDIMNATILVPFANDSLTEKDLDKNWTSFLVTPNSIYLGSGIKMKFTYNKKGQIIKSNNEMFPDYYYNAHMQKYYYDKSGRTIRIEFCTGDEGNPGDLYYKLYKGLSCYMLYKIEYDYYMKPPY